MSAWIMASDIEFSDAQLDPFISLGNILAFSARDWAAHREDAWLYGIVFGWQDALPELAERHKWDERTTRRLRLLHLAFRRAQVHQNDSGTPASSTPDTSSTERQS